MTGEAPDLGLELQRVAQAAHDRPALRDSEEELSYSDLLTEARGLAASVPPIGAEGPAPVAVLMPQGARAVVAMVACLFAGRPYCVLNPAQPRRRLEALLATIEPEVIWVADPSRREKLEAVGLPAEAPVPAGDDEPPVGPVRAGEDRICALYVTSGSSGAPKLVGYRHAATHHRFESYATALDAGPEDRFSLGSALWTAAGASALFTALLSGASLHVLDPGGTPPAALAEQIRASEATVWHSSPSLFRRLAGSGTLDGNRFRFLRFTGEPLLASDIELARRICPRDAALITTYALTEANGVVTQKVVPLEEAGPGDSADSGPPLDGVDLWIEDGGGAPVDAGVEGEIVVGGEFLSAGYVGSAEPRTGTRFSRRGRGLVLHTGDRGVVLADGALEVRGRADRQLNIRGNRIDPTEVEAAALEHDGVLDAAVVTFSAGTGDTAVALFAASGARETPLAPQVLQSHLEDLISPEARPALVKVLERLPRTAAGKVDQLRLARLAENGGRREARARGRVDPLIGHMQRLWQEALEIDEPAPDEDFFALGGDSLAAAEVCAAIETVYGVSLQPAALLEHRSAAALAQHVRGILDGGPQVSARVLRFNPSGNRPPLFLVPGAGSDATALVHFAEAIGSDQPVNVIQLPGADGRSPPVTRMKHITAHCLEAIRQTGEPEPYRIAGTSFGGLVAYDVASELIREGRQVEFLGLFDTAAPATRRGHHLTRPLHDFRVPPNMTLRGLVRNPRRERRRLGRPLRELWVSYRRIFSVLMGRRQATAELRFRYLRTGCAIAADRWTAPPIWTPVHLYRCETQPPHLAGAPLLGWDELAPDITVRELPSGHGRHIRPPAVGRLAALVNQDLARLGGSA